jgi:Secretion system C-terminal sorting domain
MQLFLHTVIGIMVISIPVISQSLSPVVIGSGGGFAQPGNISLSYTAGEPITVTLTTPQRILTQGFHQTLLSPVSSIRHESHQPFEFSFYPNPAKEMLFINVDQGSLVSIKVFDVLGQQRVIKEFDDGTAEQSFLIDTHLLISGIYIVEVVIRNNSGQNERWCKSLQIIH